MSERKEPRAESETPLSVAVGAPGSGVEGLRARLAAISHSGFDVCEAGVKLVADGPCPRCGARSNQNCGPASSEFPAIARDAIALAEQQEARAERDGRDARRLQWLLENDYVDEAIFNGTTHE